MRVNIEYRKCLGTTVLQRTRITDISYHDLWTYPQEFIAPHNALGELQSCEGFLWLLSLAFRTRNLGPPKWVPKSVSTKVVFERTASLRENCAGFAWNRHFSARKKGLVVTLRETPGAGS